MTDTAASDGPGQGTTTTTTVKVDPSPPVAPVVTIAPPAVFEVPASWRDNIPAILMVFVTGGFFGLLAMMSWHEVPAANKDMLNTAMGMVATGWTFAMKFFYDSNVGSRRQGFGHCLARRQISSWGCDMTVRYVSKVTGNDGNSGLTPALAWASINRATQAPEVAPGDSIAVLPAPVGASYAEQVVCTRPGTPGQFIKLFSTVARGALIRSPPGSYSAIQLPTSYWDIAGFDVQCGAGQGTGIDNTANGPKSHHLSVRGCYVHDSGGGGINLAWGDWFYLGYNEVARNAGLNTYQMSGMCFYQLQDNSGDNASGPRNVMEFNWSHDNAEVMPGSHSDGNGLIWDDGHNGQNSGHQTVPYKLGGLARGNLLTGNGGTGGHSAWTDGVEYDGNTLAGNNRDNSNTATWRGGLMALFSSGNVARGNLCQADFSVNPANVGMMWGQSPGGQCDWNLTWDRAKPGTASFGIDTNTPVITRHLYGVDPKLGANWMPGAQARGLGAPLWLPQVPAVATLPPDVRATLAGMAAEIGQIQANYPAGAVS